MASDYQGLKEHITAVSRRQETEDRRYRSSLYLGTPGTSRALRFSGTGELFCFSSSSADPFMRRAFGLTGRDDRRGGLRPSSIYNLAASQPVRQPCMTMRVAKEVEK